MRRTPLTAMLTIVAALAATLVVAGCGGKASSFLQAVEHRHDADDDAQALHQTGLLTLIPSLRRSGARSHS